MLKNICISIAAMTFAGLTALPAAAQGTVRVDIPLPGLEIHVAHKAPPKLRSEHKPSRPGKDYLWVNGFWHWQGSDWDWVPGRWDRPNDHGAKWVKAQYKREGPAWRYEPGHWSTQRVVEGDDYQRWKADRDKGHDHH